MRSTFETENITAPTSWGSQYLYFWIQCELQRSGDQGNSDAGVTTATSRPYKVPCQPPQARFFHRSSFTSATEYTLGQHKLGNGKTNMRTTKAAQQTTTLLKTHGLHLLRLLLLDVANVDARFVPLRWQNAVNFGGRCPNEMSVLDDKTGVCSFRSAHLGAHLGECSAHRHSYIHTPHDRPLRSP
jgi:hypothetical protein